MRKLKLYIACSLDGYIARENGAVDWLFTEGDFGYTDFYASIDTTLMGNKTYEQVLTFGDFPYPDKKNYVFTWRKDRQNTEFVEFISKDIPDFVQQLKEQSGGDIWLIGGTSINEVLIRANAIDEYWIFIHPVMLGSGIPLFKRKKMQLNLNLIDTQAFDNGLVKLVYKR